MVNEYDFQEENRLFFETQGGGCLRRILKYDTLKQPC